MHPNKSFVIAPASVDSFDETDLFPVRIAVVGVGGAGCNTINHLKGIQVEGVEYIAIGTDSKSLRSCLADKKILIGRNILQGRGAGNNPQAGLKAAEESLTEISEALKNFDMIFIIAGLGKGTGTGASPLIAKTARESSALTIGVVYTPFSCLKGHIQEIARKGIMDMKKQVNTLMVVHNQKLLDICPDAPIQQALNQANDVVANAIKGMQEIVHEQGIINSDFNDIKTVLSFGGEAILCIGETQNADTAAQDLSQTLAHPLLNGISLKGAKGILINITSDPSFTIKKYQEIIEVITKEIEGNSPLIISGLSYKDNLESKVRITLIATGIGESPSEEASSGAGENATADASHSYFLPLSQKSQSKEHKPVDGPSDQGQTPISSLRRTPGPASSTSDSSHKGRQIFTLDNLDGDPPNESIVPPDVLRRNGNRY